MNDASATTPNPHLSSAMPDIKVCDAIMGSGKTSATITYINDHPEKKFVYIAPYLTEAARICDACREMHFFEPQKKSEHRGSKLLHTFDLIQKGHSIATTHSAFRSYPPEMLDSIRQQGYTLIIDEDLNVIEEIDLSPGDLSLLINDGCLKECRPNEYCATGKYDGTQFNSLFRMLKSRNIIRTVGPSSTEIICCALPIELIASFSEVYIMTYLFEGQGLYHFLKMHGISFRYIGIRHSQDGKYEFAEQKDYIPSYVGNIDQMIHIIDNSKLNQIGDDHFALSATWFTKETSDIEQLKNNVYNFFRHIAPGCKSNDNMWATYKCGKQKLKGKGYTKGFLPFNTKATNDYRHKTALAYCVNIFMSVSQKLFYKYRGVEVNEDQLALSDMLQWIWRSAIRDGKEIWVYVPSKRMRTLLINWMDDVKSEYILHKENHNESAA